MVSEKITFPITTSRLIIRPYTAGDITEQVDAIIESVTTVGRWLPWCNSTYSVKDAAEWFVICEQSMAASLSYDLGIFYKSSRELVGSIAINEIRANHKLGNIGYWVRESAQGKGIAAEAVEAIAEFGFNLLGLVRLEIIAGVDNKASRRVAEKVNATCEGLARNRIILDKQPIDAMIYSLIPSDLRRCI